MRASSYSAMAYVEEVLAGQWGSREEVHSCFGTGRKQLVWVWQLVLSRWISFTGPCSDQRDSDDHLYGGGGRGESPVDCSTSRHHCCSDPGSAKGHHQGLWQWWAAATEAANIDTSLRNKTTWNRTDEPSNVLPLPPNCGISSCRYSLAASTPRTDGGGAPLPLSAGLGSPSIPDCRSEEKPKIKNR